MNFKRDLAAVGFCFFAGTGFSGPNFHLVCKDDQKTVLSVYDLMSPNQTIIDFQFSPNAEDAESMFRVERSPVNKVVKFEDVFMTKTFIVGRFSYEDGSLIQFKPKGETTFKFDRLKSIYIERKPSSEAQDPNKVEIKKVVLQFNKESNKKSLTFTECLAVGGSIDTWWKQG